MCPIAPPKHTPPLQTSSQIIANQCFDKLLSLKEDLYQLFLLLPAQWFAVAAGVAQPAESLQFLGIRFPPRPIANLPKQGNPAGSQSGSQFAFTQKIRKGTCRYVMVLHVPKSSMVSSSRGSCPNHLSLRLSNSFTSILQLRNKNQHNSEQK